MKIQLISFEYPLSLLPRLTNLAARDQRTEPAELSPAFDDDGSLAGLPCGSYIQTRLSNVLDKWNIWKWCGNSEVIDLSPDQTMSRCLPLFLC
jgi:hypothetical protein